MQLDKKTYHQILSKVRLSIAQTQNEITRSKVEMAWRIGKVIDESLPEKRAEEYGKNLVTLLEKDTEISSTVLYKMRNFYKAYPKLPKDDPKLNWSHYRVLSGVKEASERQALEDLTKENSWGSDELQREVNKHKGRKTESVLPESSGAARHLLLQRRQIEPNRGRLSTYKIVEVIGSDKKFFDCGFGIFWEVKKSLPDDAKVVFVEKSKIIKSDAKPQQVYTYKAYLKRLVDGDTIHANIDLGFGIWHEEIIRLAKINSAESKSEKGASAAKELQKILDSVPFFIIKSIKTDIYNRYVADIFLPKKGETNLQKIADEGVYLNQLLLDLGLAEIF